jgi:heat shock protein HslJ
MRSALLLVFFKLAISMAANAQDNSRTSLDWDGTYQGMLPCADCPGIDIRITLNPEGTYERSVRYRDREDEARVDTGRFDWDDSGGVVTLGDAGEPDARYRVGENRLFWLDRSGQRVSGPLAEHYVLKKILPDPDLEDRRWELVELMGQPVTVTEWGDRPSLHLDSATQRLAGSDGCNRLMGSYQLPGRGRLVIGQLASTMMACPDLETPDRFREMLQTIGDYRVDGDELSLFKGRAAVMARFRAVDS